MSTIYNRLSEERKKLQKEGNCPDWYTTGGYQMFKEKYLYQSSNPREQYERIAKTLACHTPDPAKWKEKFFDILWKGWLSPSTPVLANTGTTRGLPVSCAGTYISDNLDSIYAAKHEVAMLTKWGFGTASDLDGIRGRGEPISVGGNAEGLLPIIQGFQSDMEYVAQGSARRGSWAGYVGIDHNDFDEICTYLEQNPDGNNIGWNISDDFIQKLKDRDEEALRRYSKALKTKMVTGKGYFFFRDKANRKRPQWYKDHDLDIKSSQLCVAPETKILTTNGHEVISDLDNENVTVWNGEEWSNVKVVKTGVNQKLIKVITNSGFELECTPYHKFYVNVREGNSGKNTVVMKRAHELKGGDKLIKSKFPIIEGDKDLEFAYDNGFYSGDGCLTRTGKRIYLYGDKRKLKNKLSVNFKNWYVHENQDREYGESDQLLDKFFVPTSDYTVESKLKWFAGLCDSDGTIARNGKTQSIQVGSINKEFLQDVQLMLQTLGVSSKVTLMQEAGYRMLPKNDGSGELSEFYTKDAYRLLIGQYGVMTLKELGFMTHRLEITSHKPNRECSQFVKVVDVIDEGRYDDTYCFTEPKRNMGVFNGILTGNCNEIVLHSSENYTYTCVLASMNLAYYNDWKDTDAVFVATVFLDCVVQEFIERAKNIKGLEKAVEFTRKGRALGLGVMAWHSLLQQEMIPVESIEAVLLNDEVFSKLDNDSKEASKWIAEQWGEPEWMKGYGYANTHRLAIAPTKSTALVMGGYSEGGGYDTAFVFTQRTPAGEVDRINPVLLKLMKDKGVYNKKNIEEVRYAMGSVQNVDWLTHEEKLVFKTAFEINQSVVLSLASQRGKYIDQWQSLNLYFGYDADESEINKVHREAFLDDDVLGLYYIYSKAGVQASKDECVACQ